MLEATKPEDPWALEIKTEFMAFANHCIVSMPRGASIETQRETWSESLRMWEKSVPVWQDIWDIWESTFNPQEPSQEG